MGSLFSASAAAAGGAGGGRMECVAAASRVRTLLLRAQVATASSSAIKATAAVAPPRSLNLRRQCSLLPSSFPRGVIALRSQSSSHDSTKIDGGGGGGDFFLWCATRGMCSQRGGKRLKTSGTTMAPRKRWVTKAKAVVSPSTTTQNRDPDAGDEEDGEGAEALDLGVGNWGEKGNQKEAHRRSCMEGMVKKAEKLQRRMVGIERESASAMTCSTLPHKH